MRTPPILSTLLLPLCLSLAACATTGGGADDVQIPADAVATTHNQPNGDVITEYRVAGQLRIVHIQPARGPAYFLQDRNGDGRLDDERGTSQVYFKLFGW
jgi:predicted small secreted protein